MIEELVDTRSRRRSISCHIMVASRTRAVGTGGAERSESARKPRCVIRERCLSVSPANQWAANWSSGSRAERQSTTYVTLTYACVPRRGSPRVRFVGEQRPSVVVISRADSTVLQRVGRGSRLFWTSSRPSLRARRWRNRLRQGRQPVDTQVERSIRSMVRLEKEQIHATPGTVGSTRVIGCEPWGPDRWTCTMPFRSRC